MRGNWKERKHSMKPIFLWENQLEFLFLRYFYALLYTLTLLYGCVIYIRNVVESFKAAQQLAYFLTCMPFDHLLSCKVFHHFAYNLTKKLHLALKKKKKKVLLKFLAVLDRLIHFAFCLWILFPFCIYKNVCFFKRGDSWHRFGALLFPVSLIMGEAWRSQGNNIGGSLVLNLICSKACRGETCRSLCCNGAKRCLVTVH